MSLKYSPAKLERNDRLSDPGVEGVSTLMSSSSWEGQLYSSRLSWKCGTFLSVDCSRITLCY